MEDYGYFSRLFPSEIEKDIERAKDDGISFALIDSVPVFYRGVLPERKGVLLISFVSSKTVLADMYVSALEASLSGEEVVSIADRGGMLSVIKGTEDGEGRLHMVLSEGLRNYEREHGWKLRRILLTGGSVISPVLHGSDIRSSRSIALSLSSSLITASSGSYPRSDDLLLSALDAGLDVAVLRSSLTEEAMRMIVREGCPAVSSFSGSVALPKAIAYPSMHGSYGFHGSRFDIMRTQWD